MKKNSIKTFLLDLFFPQFCFNCQKEGDYLCPDCQGLLEIVEYNFCLCPKPNRLPHPGKCFHCQTKLLSGLYFATSYQNPLVKKLIQNFKYPPFVKDLAQPLSSLIINHFQLIENKKDFSDFILIPIPLEKRRLKWRGFNQAEELGKEISKYLKIPLEKDVLIKIKSTTPQVELAENERKENVLGAFSIKNGEKIKNKKILLIDDVYTTGATMEETAKVLKNFGAKEIWGVAVARG